MVGVLAAIMTVAMVVVPVDVVAAAAAGVHVVL